jgi:hypothetical protein
MAKEGQAEPGRLDAIGGAARAAGKSGPPPVHLWNPPYCGEIDMRIAADGTWYYLNTPIGRPALTKLFASVLKREDDRYFLVTPVEKCGIVVEDAPFLAVGMTVTQGAAGQAVSFLTNVGDEVECGPGHGLRFEAEPAGGLRPYVHVRRDLWARVARPVYYDLVDIGEERMLDGILWFGVTSRGEFFPMAPANSLKDLD